MKKLEGDICGDIPSAHKLKLKLQMSKKNISQKQRYKEEIQLCWQEINPTCDKC